MSIAEHAQVPAAWYPDHSNSNQLRWWNGYSWTDDVRPVLEIVEQPQPVFEQPAFEQPVFAQPVYEQPVFEQPVAAQPVFAEPQYDLPAYEQPFVAPIAAAQTSYAEPVFEQPVFEQPVFEQPVFEQPTAVAQPVAFDPYNVPEEQLRSWAPPVVDSLDNLAEFDTARPSVWPLDVIDAPSGVSAAAAVASSAWQLDAVDSTDDYSSAPSYTPVAPLVAAAPAAVPATQSLEEFLQAVPAAAKETNSPDTSQLTRRQLRELMGPLVVAGE